MLAGRVIDVFKRILTGGYGMQKGILVNSKVKNKALFARGGEQGFTALDYFYGRCFYKRRDERQQ